MTRDKPSLIRSVYASAKWKRVITVAILVPFCWWVGVRLYYYAWINLRGGTPHRNTDFSQLSRVLPPRDSTLTAMYGGLPHQMWDGPDLLIDLLTTANQSIGGYRFYAKPLSVSDEVGRSLTAALQQPSLYQPYGGPKLCGGYHPNYCFEWQSSKTIVHALLCLGCHEIIIIGGGTELHCDLTRGPGKDLEKQLRFAASQLPEHNLVTLIAESFSLFSRLEVLLVASYVAAVAAWAVGLLRVRGRILAFFSGLFALCLCPFVTCALISFLRLSDVIDVESRVGLGNLLVKLYDTQRPFYLGLATTTFMLVVHSSLFAKNRGGSPRPPADPDRN